MGKSFWRCRLAEAVTSGEQALQLDKDKAEAHHVLAVVYSTWADGAEPPPAGQTVAGARARAIEHLNAIQSTPLVATNPNLQMTLGRLQLRAGKADLGAPNLTDRIWLHGSGEYAIAQQIDKGRMNQMPAHKDILTPAKIHLLTAYVLSLSAK